MNPDSISNAPALVHITLPAGAAGQWCRVRVAAQAQQTWWAKLELTDRARGQVVRQVFLGPLRRQRGADWRQTLVHVPFAADRLTLRLFGEGVRLLDASVARLSRPHAALLLLLHGWLLLPRAFHGGRHGAAGRVRAVLGQAPARASEAPPYAHWIRLYDQWGPADHARLDAGDDHPCIQIALVSTGERGPEQATLASIERQWLAPARPTIVIRAAADWLALTGDWIGIAGAGEELAPHALASFAHAIAESPAATFLYADTDERDRQGGRCAPRFKPGPGPVLLASGWLTTGLCLCRHDAASWHTLPPEADAARLACAADQQTETLRHVPLILTHNTQPAQRPIRGKNLVRKLPRISMIVPTAARSWHVARCLRRVALGTAYPDFEIIVAVTAMDSRDRRQAAILRAVARLPRVRLLDLAMPAFNYPEANNRAAALATGECLLLLNDDVEPVGADWLIQMASLLATSGAGIVGARLLYSNLMIQHGGVIMGLAELCEHDGKYRDAFDRAAAGPGALARDISAVTAACLLVRTSLYRQLGGLDTAFAIALNDVDFCLRAGAAGARVAYCAGATLLHHESLSLGRHYQGARASLEATEVRALRARWGAVIANDPFYNPQASREPGRAWQPGFPPAKRVD